MTICYSELGAWGRLGNQLWEIASTLGIAQILRTTAEFNRWDYEPYFSVPQHMFKQEPQGTESAVYALSLPESDRFYLQDLRLWKGIEDRIREYFRPSWISEIQLEEYQWFYGLENKVAIHIRRDERPTFSESHPTPPLEYYKAAIALEEKRIDNPTFCVFSDDIAWCRSQFPDSYTFVDGYPRYQADYMTKEELSWKDHLDLFLMTDCVGHIIPNSTFSWWGAFLSDNRQPIYPAVWYGPALENVDWRLQIPSGWREVDWR